MEKIQAYFGSLPPCWSRKVLVLRLYGQILYQVTGRSHGREFNALITLNLLCQLGQEDLSVAKTWRLNERHYGGLTGLNKAETAEKHGEEQVQVTFWRDP